MNALDENGRIELLRRVLGGPTAPGTLLGIGDDAAVLAATDEPLVWSIDACVEAVHFRRELLSFEDIGYHATMAAASDLAAMGAAPLGILAAFVLPRDVDDDALERLARGQRAAADELGTSVLGGNLASGGELSVTTTVLGRAPAPLRRDGARAGDWVWMAGAVGLAAAGLRLLLADPERAVQSPSDEAAVAAWRRPRARIEDGLRARSIATSAIDVSDGLARDLGHVAGASGIMAVIDPAPLASAELCAVAGRLGVDPLELALHGGEDYALVMTAPAGAALAGFTRIGDCRARAAGAPAITVIAEGGALIPIDERGFDHFARAPSR